MDRPITIKQIESIINNHPKQKAPGQSGFTPKFYKIFKKEIIPNSLSPWEARNRGNTFLTHSIAPVLS